MIRVLSLAIGLSFFLVGCQSSGDDPAEERARLLAMKPAIDSVPSSALGPQELLVGECGLFLWSQTDVSKFIFFSKALSGTAAFAQGEIPLALTQIGAGGDIFGQFNTNMSYLTEDGRELSLSMEPGEILEGGQRIANGLINVRDKQGWDTKLPVLGVRACKQE
ncbi:MAG: hypothetical protein K0U61_08235 [Alphaproteobacteria bacterium]|nr:hypothetical protein [Alphaproteobacteria bacterium]